MPAALYQVRTVQSPGSCVSAEAVPRFIGRERIPGFCSCEAANRGGKTVKWIGGLFLAALIVIAFAIYSDAAMTRCVPGSFFAMIDVCTRPAK